VRRELVLAPVPRQERHANPAHVADGEGRRGRPVRRLDGDLVDRVDERVEPRPPEDPDGRGAQSDPFEERAGCFDPPDDPDPDEPEEPDPDDPDPDDPESDDPEPDDSDEPDSEEPDDPEDLDEDFFESDFESDDDPPSPFDFPDRLSVL